MVPHHALLVTVIKCHCFPNQSCVRSICVLCTEYNEVRDEFHNTLEGLTNLSTVLLRMILEKS